jgi:hypothetical protein
MGMNERSVAPAVVDLSGLVGLKRGQVKGLQPHLDLPLSTFDSGFPNRN